MIQVHKDKVHVVHRTHYIVHSVKKKDKSARCQGSVKKVYSQTLENLYREHPVVKKVSLSAIIVKLQTMMLLYQETVNNKHTRHLC